TIVYQVLHCDEAVQHATFNLSDGDAHSASPFAFSSNRKNIRLLPDPHQFKFNAYEHYSKLADDLQRPWKERNSVLRWRGGDNGHGLRLCYPDLAFDPSIMQRIRLCLIAANLNATDCKLTPEPTSRHIHQYRHFGLSGEHIEETDWINDRYALDIDGYTNSWRNMLTRMHLGCCVLKVTSQFGYRQWFYDQIKPWEHFVPVKADMSDLAEMLDWVRANDARAQEIARNGQAFARTQTMERGLCQAVSTIEEHWNCAQEA
ncbi:MAG: glycosyl transferase family 90, partial [Pseudomonadota bacterium]